MHCHIAAETKKRKREWKTKNNARPITTGTGNGSSLAKVFKDWLLKVFVMGGRPSPR